MHKIDTKHDLCVISIENQVFRCNQRAITRHTVITLVPVFTKLVLNQGQGSNKKKVKKFQCEQISTSRYVTKNVRGGIPLPCLEI